MPFSVLEAELAAKSAKGLLRKRRVVESMQGARAVVDGKACIAFCSNDYLGLANHPRLVAALKEGAERHGGGAGASHLISGHTAAHHALEGALAAFAGKPAALLFSTGYLANLGAIGALAGRGDTVFADKLNHASLNEAATLSRATVKRYRHNDVAQLEALLREARGGRKLVVTDAVFSMDGDTAPLPELLALCERYGAWLYVDDAHGFGVLGDEGRGTLSALDSPRVIYMATLGKAAGLAGAFVAAEAVVIETLIQQAKAYVYTTASPPLLSHALLESLSLIRAERWRRERLRQLIAQLQEGTRSLPWKLAPSATPIQPLIVGGNEAALALSENLYQRGLWVPAIRPPTVPENTARLRISLSAAHGSEDVAQLVEALHALAR